MYSNITVFFSKYHDIKIFTGPLSYLDPLNNNWSSKLALYWLLTGPAEEVRLLRFWLDQFFSGVKMNFHFYIKQVVNKSSSVIFGLVRLIILSYRIAQNFDGGKV